jgi:uncharacterized phage infection (PIP) family protein YhgE
METTTQPDVESTVRGPEPSTRPSLLVRVLRVLVGLALAALLGIGLGVLGYLGLPWLYRGLTDPMLINATRIADQQNEIVDLRATLDQVSAGEAERLAAIESQAAAQAAALAELQQQAETLASELDQVQQQASDLSGSRQQLAAHEVAIADLTEQLQALQTLILTGGGPVDRLERRTTMTQVSLHVMRARLWLIENNAGLAAEEVEAARTALARVAAVAPAEEVAPLQAVLDRLTLTQEDLQFRPLIAADDLEIAWQLLAQVLGDRPAAALVPTLTPTPTPIPTPTPGA